MRNFVSKSLYKFRLNIKRIKFEGVGLTIILSIITFILIGNIVRVFVDGNLNYSVYEQEIDSLEKLRERNENLKTSLDELNSPEQKALLARDVLEFAREGESLYRTKEQIDLIDEKIEYFDLEEIDNYSNWWLMIIR